jgi:putative transposase
VYHQPNRNPTDYDENRQTNVDHHLFLDLENYYWRPGDGLAEYFAFYNGERPHQSLNNRTPNAVYADGQGGGARIPDHVGVRTGQRCSAAIETMGAAYIRIPSVLTEGATVNPAKQMNRRTNLN